MSADAGWSPGADPPRDPAIDRLLRGAGRAAPLSPADEDRLHGAIMAAVRAELARLDRSGVAWWEVAAGWVPAAAAAGLVAVLLSTAVFLSAALSGGIADDVEAPPETAAVAQVLARYPGDAVLASLLAGDASDTLTAWTEP